MRCNQLKRVLRRPFVPSFSRWRACERDSDQTCGGVGVLPGRQNIRGMASQVFRLLTLSRFEKRLREQALDGGSLGCGIGLGFPQAR